MSKIFIQVEGEDMDRFLNQQDEIAETLSRLLSIIEGLVGEASND